MKYKTAELEGALLDAAVAKALGYATVYDVPDRLCGEDRMGGVEPWMPSTNWAQGGTIIERVRISIECANIANHLSVTCAGEFVDDGSNYDVWRASILDGNEQFATLPLIAAMRAYIASRFGEEVELP